MLDFEITSTLVVPEIMGVCMCARVHVRVCVSVFGGVNFHLLVASEFLLKNLQV